MSGWLVSLPFPEWAEARFPVEKGDNWSKNIVGDLELLILMTKAGSPFNKHKRLLLHPAGSLRFVELTDPKGNTWYPYTYRHATQLLYAGKHFVLSFLRYSSACRQCRTVADTEVCTHADTSDWTLCSRQVSANDVARQCVGPV